MWCVCAQAIASPASGIIGDKSDRTKVIAAGCLLWGVMTSAIAMSDSVHEVWQVVTRILQFLSVPAAFC